MAWPAVAAVAIPALTGAASSIIGNANRVRLPPTEPLVDDLNVKANMIRLLRYIEPALAGAPLELLTPEQIWQVMGPIRADIEGRAESAKVGVRERSIGSGLGDKSGLTEIANQNIDRDALDSRRRAFTDLLGQLVPQGVLAGDQKAQNAAGLLSNLLQANQGYLQQDAGIQAGVKTTNASVPSAAQAGFGGGLTGAIGGWNDYRNRQQQGSGASASTAAPTAFDFQLSSPSYTQSAPGNYDWQLPRRDPTYGLRF